MWGSVIGFASPPIKLWWLNSGSSCVSRLMLGCYIESQTIT